ncbi:hyaluronoglucosaminidase [Ancylostoma ceylanicum]|uniref:Hyaluronidase n=1 Tax=Ancylostoma ceylanicum TaxID=53326 RepID=A0A0D6LAN3_9BILA|nr:hyaluronoglucosaminidase [Ancylostoma ceylanicum]
MYTSAFTASDDSNDSDDYSKIFKAYWNFPSRTCRTNYSIKFEDYRIETNKNLSFYGEKVVIFYEFIFGNYPYYKNYKKDQPVNGGTPQNCSLEKHLEIARKNITDLIPENFEGLAIIDLEEWRPLFDQNFWGLKSVSRAAVLHEEEPDGSSTPRSVCRSAILNEVFCMFKVFRNQSIAIVKEKNPNLENETEIAKLAEKEFNDAAKKFFVKTIQLGRELRPGAKWGFYGFPYCNYNAGKNGTYECWKKYQDWNDKMMFIFNESTALFPSIYLGSNATSDERFRYVQAVLKEARRISEKFKPPLPIYAYTKIEYDPLREIDSFYNDHDLCSTIKQPADLGIDGIIIWSSSRNMTLRCPHIKEKIEGSIGLCSDHSSFLINTEEYKCECDKGFTGEYCSPSDTTSK